jgi:4-amino-4-deoxy-L-arabinose transferase-like glycosyltransferase
MMSLLTLAIWSMDRWAERGKRRQLLVAALATAGALLLKVIAAYVLIVFGFLAYCRWGRSMVKRWELWLALLLAVAPAAAWYLHAWEVATSGSTVSTPFWQAHKWIALERLGEPETYRQLAYFVGLRVLTPVGVILAMIGVLVRVPARWECHEHGEVESDVDRGLLFHVWLASLLAYLPILIRKLDHEHYYLAGAPVAAVFAARAIRAIGQAPLGGRLYLGGRAIAALSLVLYFGASMVACASTYRVPAEWNHVLDAAHAARTVTEPDALVAGHSSVLFYADRRGFTFAYGPDEIEYLFGTWGKRPAEASPMELLDFYRGQGADYFVELLGTNREHSNREFFERVRQRFQVVAESPGQFMVVALRE